MDELVFAEEEVDNLAVHEPWIVLIVDDDTEVHSMTRVALQDFIYEQRKILCISAYSAKEAHAVLEQRDDIAIILLDVIMETNTAGLDLVKTIRNQFQNNRIRIIICTGQAGVFSNIDVIDNYDINDYREKTELTADRLYVTIRSSLSQYKQILELESSKESFRNQHMLLQKIIDLVPSGMFWKDMNGVYLGANKQFVEDAKLDDISEIIGKNDFDMIWRKIAQQYKEDDAAVINSGMPKLQYEEKLLQNDDSFLDVVTSKVALRDMHDNIIGVLGVYNDITEFKALQNEAKVKDAKLLLQSRMAQMGEMTSMIAHQWRQPLNTLGLIMQKIKIFNDKGLLTTEKIDDNIDKGMYVIQDMSKVINDFMQTVKGDSEKHLFNFMDVLNSVEVIMGEQLKNKNIKLINDVDSSLEINSYKNQFFHILINLISNACDAYEEKAINEKIISIKCTIADDVFECIVKDNAGGIPESVINQVFDPYFTTKELGKGTGLGLDMSKKIVQEMLNGTIDVHNDADGAIFTIKVKL